MTPEEFLKQEYEDKGYENSCFSGIEGVDFSNIQSDIFTSEEVIAFTEAYIAQLTTIKSSTNDLIQELRDRGFALSIWQIGDIKHQCKRMEVTLSKDQMLEVLKRADKNHDANIGINWTVLSCHIDDVLRKSILEKKQESERMKHLFLAYFDGSFNIDAKPNVSSTYEMGVTKVEYEDGTLTVHLRRPGLLIGKRGSTINDLSKYLECKILPIEVDLLK